jgi:hypothetical protein
MLLYLSASAYGLPKIFAQEELWMAIDRSCLGNVLYVHPSDAES